MLKKHKQPAGLAKLIILIILAVLLLSYFGVSIQKIAESETGKSNFAYLGSILGQFWGYLVSLYQQSAGPFLSNFWNDVIIRQAWESILNFKGKFF